MDYSFRLHTKHYYRVVKAREDRGLPVNQTYKKMVNNATLIKQNPDIFETEVAGVFVGLIGKLKFIL